jgi:hypothetical protein
VYFTTVWNISWPFGIIYGRLVLFVVICYIFPILVCWDQGKSGNPARSGFFSPLRFNLQIAGGRRTVSIHF